jgi:hypothetical protein
MMCGEGREEQKGEVAKRLKETFSVDGYIHYLNYSADFMGIYICQNLSSCVL